VEEGFFPAAGFATGFGAAASAATGAAGCGGFASAGAGADSAAGAGASPPAAFVAWARAAARMSLVLSFLEAPPFDSSDTIVPPQDTRDRGRTVTQRRTATARVRLRIGEILAFSIQTDNRQMKLQGRFLRSRKGGEGGSHVWEIAGNRHLFDACKTKETRRGGDKEKLGGSATIRSPCLLASPSPCLSPGFALTWSDVVFVSCSRKRQCPSTVFENSNVAFAAIRHSAD